MCGWSMGELFGIVQVQGCQTESVVPLQDDRAPLLPVAGQEDLV